LSKTTTWRSPSNIALVKYWGKYHPQLPANPSISFTLDQCYTETTLSLLERSSDDTYDVDILLDGEPQESFKPKITKFLDAIQEEIPFTRDHKLRIETHNSFPHSSGIASSASGMSALALCLLTLKEEIERKQSTDFFRKASEWSRLGSGSASRSVYGGLVEWGRFAGIAESNDEYAIPYGGNIHPIFQDFCDYVLLVETGSKKVSSTAGHGLMENHPYAERRFLQAHENLSELLHSISSGELEKFGTLVESEALTLHAMMMTSSPYFILMKPNTVHILEQVWDFRKETGHPLYFTLDAGANVHLLFPATIEQAVKEFVRDSLTGYLKNAQYICDRVGQGPVKIR
tara:strand:+ start:25314 stop:26348 length:1035 start_codon:yes stop_codon:yes gene_type:complete